MKQKFVKCDFCKTEIPSDACQMATYHTEIDGKQYVFCCERCAERYQKTK